MLCDPAASAEVEVLAWPVPSMLQCLRSSPAIPRPDPLGLSIAQLQQLAGFSQPQVAALTLPITSARLSSLLLNPVLPNLSPSCRRQL